MIQWAKTNGYQYFDFFGIEANVAEALLSSGQIPEALKENSLYGATMYKLKFGGNIIKYPGSYMYYSDKMKHLKETSSDELENLMICYKKFYWAEKNFFRDRKASKFVL